MAKKLKLPECGIFIGSGVYPSTADYFLSALHGHQAWQPQTDYSLEMIDKILKDNQGNLAQVWGVPRGTSPAVVADWIYALDEIGVHVPEPNWETGEYVQVHKCKELKEHADRKGAGLVRFAQHAAERGIYTTFIYTSATPEWSHKLCELGDFYLGYDFGERFNFSANIPDKDYRDVTLGDIAEYLIAKVKEHCDEKIADGWGAVMATSSNFCIDYEMLGGASIPLVEDFAFSHIGISSALSRGLYRQHDLPAWGTHLAHEHYSWIPNASKYKFPILRASMYQKYMAGSKIIINESGNWFVEASLCEDSPKHTFPRVPLTRDDVSWHGEKDPKFIPYISEARKHYHKIDYNSGICTAYRKEISDFYDFVKENGTPAGQPESTVAVIKGNHDLSGHRYGPTSAVGGAQRQAMEQPGWLSGAPELTWDSVKAAFYPLKDILGDHKNIFYSGTPCGQVDIVSFAQDEVTAENLSANYRALLFSGWNTCSEKQYAVLKQYVEDGGTLFVSIPHLSTDDKRNYLNMRTDDLINNGDFSDLCGLKVKGRAKHFFWVTAPCNNSEIVTFPRRFGVFGGTTGDIEITDPSIETLLVDDEDQIPVLLRRKCGKGTVYFMNTWQYPGAFNTDTGPGSTKHSPGMPGTIYRYIASQVRGKVWITDDGENVLDGKDCEYVTYSYFPESEQICLLNVDFDNPRSFKLHIEDKVGDVTLAPGEFRLTNR